MPVCDSYTIKDTLGHFVCAYQLDWANVDRKELEDTFDLMKDADSLGSIMRFEISQDTREHLIEAVNAYDAEPKYAEAFKNLIDGFRLIIALTENYHALVMNPPYMGGGNMNGVLSKYVKDNYKNGKADLATVFVEMMGQRTSANGSYAFIIPPSWMFLSTFEGLRKNIIENQSIGSLLHLSRGVFGADFGASSAVIKNTSNANACGTYFRLVERTFQEFEQSHLRMLFEQTLANHDFKYNFKEYTKDVTELPYSEDGNRIYYPNVEQMNFEKIPGAPIGYWVSPKIQEIFTSNLALSAVASPCVGLQTADNARFLRLWFEPSYSRIGFGCENAALAARSQKKWFPTTKGGTFRRWFGNMYYVVNWENDGEELTNFKGSVIRNRWRYFTKCGATWSTIASGKPSFRYFDKSWLFETKGSVCFPEDEKKNNIIMGYLNSPLVSAFLQTLAPTLDYHEGPMSRIPYIDIEDSNLSDLVEKNIALSKSDWNAHETSWDFQRNELLSIDADTYTENIDYKLKKHFEETGEHISLSPAAPQLGSLEWRMEQYKTKWERKFMQLHKNEEELNRQFIDIYGLQDELTPDVPLNEITILQQGEIDVTENGIAWNEDAMTKQLISYAVGCMLGRYRLDKPGLHIAHPNPTDEEIAPYEYNGEQWEIDDDGIMPLMPNDCGFSDNASARFADFIRVALGNEEHVANLNYVEQCLGKTLEQYFVKDFWKDHKKMYQNRPIYWLFSSKKGAFQVIAYMHRMNAYTAERVRSKYLLPYIEHLEAEIDKLDARRAELSTKETKQLQALKKQLDECREYHERLQVVAEQAISFDLDDGVVVNYAKFGDILQKIK